MDDPGPSKPLKGILKKGTTPPPDPVMHETDCPMSASFSVTGLPNCCVSGVANALGQPLKGILRTNLRGSMSDSNPNGTKCRCSITMLDDTSEEDMCLCKRKKSQSWNEISILETQHPSRQDPSSTQPCYLDIADRTWQSFTIDDVDKEDSNSSGCSHDQQPMSPQSDQEPETEELLERPRPPDQVQVMDTSPAGMNNSLETASQKEVLEEENTDEGIDLEDRERTSFEELRKAYIRETRQVLLDKAFEVEYSDEDEIDQDAEDGTFPDVQSTARSLTSAADSADAADPDGGEWSGQTSQWLQTENRD